MRSRSIDTLVKKLAQQFLFYLVFESFFAGLALIRNHAQFFKNFFAGFFFQFFCFDMAYKGRLGSDVAKARINSVDPKLGPTNREWVADSAQRSGSAR